MSGIIEDMDFPFWLHVRQEGEYLCVYRSVLVDVDDPRLESVNSFLSSREHEQITVLSGADPNMMFGEAVISVYWIGERFESAAS